MQKQILLIDDDADEMDFFIDALRTAGLDFKYWSASGLMQALSILDKEVPHYIFLDFNMPKANGIECLVKIKELDHVKNIPVIMYSSSMEEEDIQAAMILGAIGCIKKPYDMRVLPSLIKPYL